MVLTVTEDTPADMLAGSMELLVQIPRDHHVQTQRVTVQRSTPMMDLLVQIATAHKLAASSYTLQAIGERGLVLSHQPNTPIGALDALQVKLLPKQGTLLPRRGRPASQPFETTFRLQVHLPRNQLYVSRVSPKTNLGEILDEVCREKNLDRNKYELRHPAHLSETLDLSLALQDYHLQEVTLFPRQQARSASGQGLSSQDIMALQKQEEHRRNQARQGVFGFMFKNKSKESSLSSDSLGNRSVSPARSDEIDGSKSQQQPPQSTVVQLPSRPLRKRRPAPKPPTTAVLRQESKQQTTSESKSHSKQSSTTSQGDKDKIVISHSRNSSDSSGYHEASVLSDNPDNSNGTGSGGRMPETLPRRGRMQGILEAPRKLAQTSHASKSLGNLAVATNQGGTLSRGISNTSLSSNGQRKKRAAPPPPVARPLPSAISAQGLERIVDSDESLTSDMDLSKPSSDIDAAATGSSQASSDIACHIQQLPVESARVVKKELPVPRPRKVLQVVSLSSPEQLDSDKTSPIASPSPSTSSINAPPSFGLPSLTEDEEIALAIDSIVQASRGHVDDSPDTSIEIRCDVNEELKKLNEKVVVEDEIEARVDKLEGPVEQIKKPVEITDPVINVDVHVDPEEPAAEKEGTRSKPEAVLEQTKATAKEAIEEAIEETCIKAPSCAVISTIPKCDHVEPFSEKADFSVKRRGNKVVRSQSETGHFEVGPAEKHSRHLTTNGEAFTFALNTNLGEDAARIIEASGSVTTDTDILLQKVSDTLTITALAPPSPPPTPEDLRSLEPTTNLASDHSINDRPEQDKILDGRRADVNNKESNSQPKQQQQQQQQQEAKCRRSVEVEDAGSSSTNSEASSANNSTNQQDTSDYVSASGEELSSITDWEYQIPAPPSAFRDDEDAATASSTTITQLSTVPQPIKESISIEAEVHQVQPKKHAKLSSTTYIQLQKPVSPEPKDSVEFTQLKTSKLSTQTSTEQLKKADVISELENKISNNKPVVVEAQRTDETDAPKIAPVENNLANFTITTYSRQKSLDIFEPMDQQQHEETRVLNTFATLTRGRSLASDYVDEKMGKIGPMKSAISMERVSTPGLLVDDKPKFGERIEVLREKPVHRSKSYIILSSNEKFQNKSNEVEKKRQEVVDERVDYKVNDSSRRMTSLVNLNTGAKDEVLNHKEKFSQWRENMLRKHEEPSPEKQLQSLQVLKSILPQLKNAQATAENNYKIANDSFMTKKRQEIPQEVIEPPPSLPSEVKLRETANRRVQDAAKRYTYGGPPSISLGSWSERPSLNVQIKTDTDYKFGCSNSPNSPSGSSTSGARTVVNLNGGGVEKEEKKISGFRKVIKEEKKDDEPRVDTSSVAFKDLTKAFGQEVRLRPKPVSNTRVSQNRYSEYIERPRQNGFTDSHVTTTNNTAVNQNRSDVPTPPIKRYTSVVGITNNNNNNNINDNNVSKNNVMNGSIQQNNFRFSSQNKPTPPPASTMVVKSFNGQEKEYTVPKPPTMPIITGVTLKSVNARSKNPPMIQQDPRDQLLESIRNFGGRGNLRKATDKY